MQTVPAHPSWTAYKLRSKGTLAVSGGRAIFNPKSGDPLVIDNVMKVTKGWSKGLRQRVGLARALLLFDGLGWRVVASMFDR